jgi:hypothetical protein
LYCSLLLLTWGIFFKHITLTVATLAVTATVFLVLVRERKMDIIMFIGRCVDPRQGRQSVILAIP